MNFKSVIAMIDIREYSRTLTLNISKMLYPNRNLSYTIHQYYPELTGVSIPGSIKFIDILVMRLHIAHNFFFHLAREVTKKRRQNQEFAIPLISLLKLFFTD